MKIRRFRILSITLLLAAMCMIPFRCWAETRRDHDYSLAEGATLRIMSYNLMHPDWSRVPITGRVEIVTSIFLDYRPDVVAVQEAGAKWHKALIPVLVDTGLYSFACRKSNADGFTYNTTCFLYNPDTVSVVDEYILDLDFRDATRVFSIAVFERNSDGAMFVVSNTHPAPREEHANYSRNMEKLSQYAADTITKYADLPVIMAGDFNTPEQTDAYLAFMSKAKVRDAKYAAKILVKNYPTYFGYQVEPNTENFDLCVDHIFVNEYIEVVSFDAVIDHDVMNASDHIPIFADININRAESGE